MAKYIGKRIVPKHCGVWEQTKSYEMLSIVLEETSGDSYIARRAVPSGTAITDTNYWMLHSLYSQQIKDMSDQLTATEARIRADNDATEAAIRQDNDATEAAIREDNQQTKEYVDSSLEETTETLTQTVTQAQTAMTQQKASFDQTAAVLNTRMDAVLAAGTGAGDTEILDARVDAEGNTHETLGAAIRSVGAEIVDGRVGLGNEKFDSLASTMKGFSRPFTLQHRFPLTNSIVVLATGESGSTIPGVEDICDERGTARAAKFTADIVKDYAGGSIMARSHFPVQDFKDFILGKRLIVQIMSPISGVFNISVGSSSTRGGGAIDDLNGDGLMSDGTLPFSTISYNLTVAEGYNEFPLNMSEELPQVQKLVEAIDEREWSQVCVSMIPFKWQKCTFVPETGQVYEFILAVCDEASERESDDFTTPIVATARRAHQAKQAYKSDYAQSAGYAERSGNAVNSENSTNAGIQVLGKSVYSTHNNLKVKLEPSSGVVEVKFGNDCLLTTGQGFSIQIGTVGDLKGKKLVLKRDELEGYSFKLIAVNFGASFGSHSYVYPSSAITEIGSKKYLLDFDVYIAQAEREGISTSDELLCWLMLFGNENWDVSGIPENTKLTNSYQVFEVMPTAFVYSQEIIAMTNEIEQLKAEKDSQATEIEVLRQQVNLAAQSNVLWSKKWFATGDSFTSGGSTEDDKYFTDEPYQGKIKTYPLFIGRRNNMEVINDAISGSIMALDKTYVEDPENVNIKTRNPFSLERYLTIPEDVDYITLWFGINDAGHTNLGTIDDTTNETFYGAWNVVLEWILTNRPWAHVGMIITNGSSVSYRNAERELARKWGIPYLDMMGSDQTPVMTLGRETDQGLCKKAYDLRRTTFAVGHAPTGDSHPCWQAHEYEATFIEAFLRRL
ncbi:MAG: SGNH/GDSL hydrolase family protein [Syntrophales bacterium]|nr:SGNH/GDSL hydrolase family protein [Syntrophales bacterium]